MHPFSYTGMKIIHDQKIQEALAQPRLDAEQATQGPGLLQTFKKFLARFNTHLARNKPECQSDCAEMPSFLAEAASSRSPE